MSYYTLPKTNNIPIFSPNIKNNNIEIYTSHSLFYYYNKNKNTYDNNVENISVIINSYEYIFNKNPDFNLQISKLKNNSNIFYDLLEIIITLNIFDNNYGIYSNINSIHISENCNDTIECINFLGGNEMKSTVALKNINTDNFANLNNYTLNMLHILMILLKYQDNNGNCIIKINHLFYKPIIDILYMLSSLYEKINIIKPNTSEIISFDKYIVCKKFILNENKKEIYKNYYFKIAQFISEYSQNSESSINYNISSIIDCDIPYYFINKIDDINIIFGQQQLEAFDQINNILKNKNKEEKLETIKKNNIQKCISWCEKFKVPCNKFLEKTNMFLPLHH